MIVRILGEGQYDVPAGALDRLNELDGALEKAIADDDDDRFRTALGELLDAVRRDGRPHDVAALDSSEVILPPADATIGEVRDLLSDDGLIPG